MKIKDVQLFDLGGGGGGQILQHGYMTHFNVFQKFKYICQHTRLSLVQIS